MSFLDRVEHIWSGWEIRFSVLLSLLLQIVLIVFGNRRKYSRSTWVGVVIWVAYLLSDWVATFSLGLIFNTQIYSCPSADKSIQALRAVMVLWAPFLLVHLGGPDTITAYSLEDNELWLRHLFGFLVQVGPVFYLLVLSWMRSSVKNDTWLLAFTAIPVFISGVLKYGEKTWVLWCSSSERFKRTSRPPCIDKSTGIFHWLFIVMPETRRLVTADWAFKILKAIVSKLPIESQYYSGILRLLSCISPEEAFKVIEIELGFLYDVFFTKALVAHSRTGLILRSISLTSSSTAFLFFVIGVDKHKLSLEDVIITYVLVVGAICADIYNIIMLIFSYWTLLHLTKQKRGFGNLLYRPISASPSASMNRKMWSGSMAQLNLISFCIGDKPAQYGRIQKLFGIYESLEIDRYKTWENVETNLKKMILENIKERCGSINSTSEINTQLNSRGAYMIRKRRMDRFLEWSLESLEVGHSILTWHIATNFCYYDLGRSQNNEDPSRNLKGMCKSLSDYMVYLVVCRPFMLPPGNYEIEYRETCDEASTYIRQIDDPALNSHLIFREIGRRCRIEPSTCQQLMDERVNGSKPKFFLSDGYFVAKLLLECDDRWEVIAGVWIEMLCYVANKCDWKYHIQELSRGGELLTHVRLLMAHLGLADQTQTVDVMEHWREKFAPRPDGLADQTRTLDVMEQWRKKFASRPDGLADQTRTLAGIEYWIETLQVHEDISKAH